MATYVTELRCDVCRQESEHDLTYAGNLLVSCRCRRCRTEYRAAGPDFTHEYLADLKSRILSKPSRMWRRLRSDPSQFLSTLPRAIVRQPPKFLDEWRTVYRDR